VSEKLLSREFCKLVQQLFPIRLENAIPTPGLPDILLVSVGQLVELKWAREWPKRGGALRLPHFSTEQKNWAQKCIRKGGTCWLLLMCKAEWFIFHGSNPAYYLVGDLTQEELTEKSDAYFKGKPTGEALCDLFREANGYKSAHSLKTL
jgi:hypothetical protein